MIQIFPFKYHNNFIASHAHEIRRKVFVLEQHVEQDLEFDEHEPQCQHYLAYLDNRSVGTARWRITDEGLKLDGLPYFRSTGIKELELCSLNI